MTGRSHNLTIMDEHLTHIRFIFQPVILFSLLFHFNTEKLNFETPYLFPVES